MKPLRAAVGANRPRDAARRARHAFRPRRRLGNPDVVGLQGGSIHPRLIVEGPPEKNPRPRFAPLDRQLSRPVPGGGARVDRPSIPRRGRNVRRPSRTPLPRRRPRRRPAGTTRRGSRRGPFPIRRRRRRSRRAHRTAPAGRAGPRRRAPDSRRAPTLRPGRAPPWSSDVSGSAAPVHPPPEGIVQRNAVLQHGRARGPARAGPAKRHALRGRIGGAAARPAKETESGDAPQGIVCGRRRGDGEVVGRQHDDARGRVAHLARGPGRGDRHVRGDADRPKRDRNLLARARRHAGGLESIGLDAQESGAAGAAKEEPAAGIRRRGPGGTARLRSDARALTGAPSDERTVPATSTPSACPGAKRGAAKRRAARSAAVFNARPRRPTGRLPRESPPPRGPRPGRPPRRLPRSRSR